MIEFFLTMMTRQRCRLLFHVVHLWIALVCVRGFTVSSSSRGAAIIQNGPFDIFQRRGDARTEVLLFSTSQQQDNEKDDSKVPSNKKNISNNDTQAILTQVPLLESKKQNETQQAETNDAFQSKNLVENADVIVQLTATSVAAANKGKTNATTTTTTSVQRQDKEESSPLTTRRMLFATGLFGIGTALGAAGGGGGGNFNLLDTPGSRSSSSSSFADSRLNWEVTPVNKRTGVTVYDAEQAGYNLRFVTYLSRFLLSFDADCQRWWQLRAQDLPRLATAQEITSTRLQQFAAFSASVEVGLQAYDGPQGPAELLQSLQQRYCRASSTTTTSNSTASSMSDAAREKQEREIKEARRQIALLFGLMEKNQPVQEISKLLAAIDNGSVGRVEIVDPGAGYAPGYGSPQVIFPPPDGGEGYEQATGRASLEPNGRILRVDVVNRGSGYKSPPVVTIAPPAALRFQAANETNVEAEQAQAKAFLFRTGPNKGRIERIQLTNPGKGYTKSEIIKVRFSSPQGSDRGVTATATAILEYQVARIDMVNNGTGYAVERPIQIYVEPPPLTARVNMNDPLTARLLDSSQPLPATTVPSAEMRKKMPDPADFTQTLSSEANRAACIGRGCYDKSVVAIAYPIAEKDSYDNYRTVNDTTKVDSFERELDERSIKPSGEGRVVSATTSGKDSRPPELPSLGIASTISSSSQLLSLLPAGVGLEFDEKLGRYVLAVDPTYSDDGIIKSWRSYQDFDPDFGPRGRTPIERDMDNLSVGTYLRFVASGAICCSAVHLALTPIDVVKTKIQTEPEKYPGMISGFKRVLEEGGMSSFFTGWAPTFLGYFVWGGVAYSITEFLRRTFQGYAGDAAGNLEVPIILAAAGLAAVVGSFAICPFEAVRIRSVAQPGYGSNIFEVSRRLIREEGVGSLFSAVPVFMAKEIPFAMAKFTTFDLSTAWMYENFPAAREDLQLSLLVSLAGGTIGGVVAGVVSNPADATISQMKKAKNDMGPVAAVKLVVKEGGIPGLFRGLPLRLVFYSLMVSMQFLIYDAVRFALGVGSDDLVLYLDVLGGALSETGGPA